VAAESPVKSLPPPAAVVRVMNAIVRTVAPSPLGRVVPVPFVVLRFNGRRTGRTYRIVVAWHDVDGRKAAFSSRPWATNLRGGAPIAVAHRGRWRHGIGRLVEDPAIVADAMQQVIDGGTSPRILGLDVPSGRRLAPEDIRAVGRKMIALDLED
jgi:hypothetical protein